MKEPTVFPAGTYRTEAACEGALTDIVRDARRNHNHGNPSIKVRIGCYSLRTGLPGLTIDYWLYQ